MKLKLEFAKQGILNKNGINHLRFSTEIENKHLANSQKPLLTIFILDKSGSMDSSVTNTYLNYFQEKSTSKLEQAKKSIIEFSKKINNHDLIGLVEFDNNVNVIQEPIHLDSEDKLKNFVKKVVNIESGGSTNISKALMQARTLITNNYLYEFNCKFILLSDGNANSGLIKPTDFENLTATYLEEGITVSSLGIGDDYDTNTMDSIAVGGGGLFYHIKEVSMISRIFEEEKQLSSNVEAYDTKLLLKLPNLIKISENLNKYKQNIINNYIEINLGNLTKNKKIYFEIENSFVNEDIIFEGKIIYRDRQNKIISLEERVKLPIYKEECDLIEAKENVELINEVLDIIKQKNIKEGLKLYDEGNSIEASRTINNISLMDSFSYSNNELVNTSIDEINKDLINISNSFSNNSLSRSDTKTLYSQTSRLLRK